MSVNSGFFMPPVSHKASRFGYTVNIQTDPLPPKRKRWLWIAFWTALAIVTALMWPWDWAGGNQEHPNECRRLRSRPVVELCSDGLPLSVSAGDIVDCIASGRVASA